MIADAIDSVACVQALDSDIASAVTGSLMWLRLEDEGLVPEAAVIDRERTLDLLCRLQEHDIQPEHAAVLAFLVQLARDAYPEALPDYKAGYDYIMAALEAL
jgi:hypothetical protein